MARDRRSHATSAAVGLRPEAGGGRARRVEQLLSGELLDTSRLSYDFDVENVGLVGMGPDAEGAIGEGARSLGGASLIVRSPTDAVWAWVGKPEFGREDLDTLGSIAGSAELRLAIGEPAPGLAGWRLTHDQARAALPIALRGVERVVRYSHVALVATVVRDELLADSLRRLYLDPLDDQPGRGRQLRQTLRAYFDADRSVSGAGAAIGVTRQTVARRLATAEERLGRPIAHCAADLELALRFELLGPTPPVAP